MIKTLYQCLLIGSFALPPAIAQSGSIGMPSLSIYPDQPIANLDTVYAELGGIFPHYGYAIDELVVTIEENNIGIDFNSTTLDGIWPMRLWPFSVEAEIGLLDAGTYNVSAGFYLDGNLEHTLSDSFWVAPVPLPAGIWLFGSAIAGLFLLRRKSNITA